MTSAPAALATLSPGSRGPEVRAFRKELLEKGLLSKKAPDSDVYDHWMVQAVRRFQIKQKLIVTGAASPELRSLMLQDTPSISPTTRKQLFSDGVTEQMTAHMRNVLFPQEALLYVPQPLSHLSLSEQGKLFLTHLEGSVSHFYVPSEGSGLTVGVGYDLKERKPAHVKDDLTQAGIWKELTPEVQKLWLTAAETKGDNALLKLFAEEHDSDVLTASQSKRLLAYIVEKKYLPRLRSVLPASLCLLQPQFDALVAFVYNLGSLTSDVARPLSQKPPDLDAAVRAMASHATSNKVLNLGVASRREKELRLFLYGHYGRLNVRHGRQSGPSRKDLLKSIPTRWERATSSFRVA